MATFYDVCNGIWGGCPATKRLEHGIDSTEGFALVQLHDQNNKEQNSDEQIAGQNAPPLEPISPEPPVINNDVASVANVDSDTENGAKRVPGQKPLIEHLKDKRHSKLSKTKSIENQQLAVMREDLALKKTMITKMEKMDEENNKTLNKFANTMENLSQAVLSALGGRQAPYPWQQQPLPHPGFSQSEEISLDLCCFYGGGTRHNEDTMHSFQIPNHPPPLETRIWKLVVRALTTQVHSTCESTTSYVIVASGCAIRIHSTTISYK